MATHREILVENSISAALACIEIYNKPDFKYREQSFTILNVNAWELLLKAKVLLDSGDDITSLYVTLPDGGYKINRSGNPLTIEIFALTKRVTLDTSVAENIKALVEIRDTVVHFYYDEALSYLIYSLGVASLKNYQKLVKTWVGRSLLEYNFHILPLAFSYDFRTLALLELGDKPEAVANIIRMVSESHEGIDSGGEFHFVCEVTTEVKSAKKFADGADFTTVVDPEANPGTTVYIKHQNLLDKYPLSFKELVAKVQQERREVNVNQVSHFAKEHGMKENVKFSAYNFRNKQQENRHKTTGVLPKSIASIYNQDAVRFVVENIGH
jgi:hypothetical protein